MYSNEDMDAYADQIRDLLIDDVATLSKYINDRDYARAGAFMGALARSFDILSPAFTMEALTRFLSGTDGP